MNRFVSGSTTYLADIGANTGTNLQNIILPILGSVLLVLVAGRLISAIGEGNFGKIVSLLTGAVLVAFFIFAPTAAMNVLKDFATAIFES